MISHNIDFFKIIAKNMTKNLGFIKIYPKNILIFGADYSQSYNLLKNIYKNAKFLEIDIRENLLQLSKNYLDNKLKELFFPRKKQLFCGSISKIQLSNQFDILWSNLFLVYKFQDINNIISKWIQLLKKDGMLFCSLLGMETLKEVVAILNSNGIFCNVEGLFDIQELGDKLFSYNFKDIVLHSEKIIFHYKKYSNFNQDLAVISLLNNLKFKNQIEHQEAMNILKVLFSQNKLGNITFEILYIHALKDANLNHNTIKLFPVN